MVPNSDIGGRRVRKLELIFVFILVQFMHTYLLFPYCENTTAPRVIKLFSMLNSAEHEIHPAHKC